MISGKNIDLRRIEVSDAEFVLSLRLDPNLNQYISPVENNLKKQQEWIEVCNNDKSQWYFIIQNKECKPVGTVRIYDIVGNSFCWGSWIIQPPARSYASFESVILLYQYAFFDLGFTQSHFDVRKENDKVINFHLKFGAVITDSNDSDLFFVLKKKVFKDNLAEYNSTIDRALARRLHQKANIQ